VTILAPSQPIFGAADALPSWLAGTSSTAAGCLDRDRFLDSGRGAISTGNRSARPPIRVRFLGLFLGVARCRSRSFRTRPGLALLEPSSRATPPWQTSPPRPKQEWSSFVASVKLAARMGTSWLDQFQPTNRLAIGAGDQMPSARTTLQMWYGGPQRARRCLLCFARRCRIPNSRSSAIACAPPWVLSAHEIPTARSICSITATACARRESRAP
jgi:hypothetical protein